MKRSSSLPKALEATLVAGHRRVRRILAVRGVCTTLAVFIAATLGVMAIDAMVTIFSPLVRWALTTGLLAATAATAYVALVKPLRRLFTLPEIAALIERNHPELEERLSTAVELAEEDTDATLASPELVAEIARAATEDVGRLAPAREFTGRTVKPRFWAAAGAFLVLAVLFALFPTATSRLVARALVPSAEVDNVYASALSVTPGDRTVLAGTSVEIGVAVDAGFPSRVFIRTSVGGRAESVERMTRASAEGEPARYAFVYPAVAGSFAYRVHCGSAVTRAYRIEVIPEPTYFDRRITVEHPAYTGRPADTYTNSPAVVALAGSTATIRVRRSRSDVTGAVLLSDGRRIEPHTDGDVLSFTFPVADGGVWTGEVVDSHGFSNRVETAAVEVAKDAPPEVRLVAPEERVLKLPRTGVLPVEIEARDDFGISRRVVEIGVGAGEWKDLRDLEGNAETFALASLPLEKAGTFRLRVRVEDNLPAAMGGPNVARSETVSVEIADHGGQSLAKQELSEEIAAAKKTAEEIRRHLDKARNSLGPAKDLGRDGWQLEHARRSLDIAKNEMTNADGLLSDFIESLRETRLERAAEIFESVEEKNVQPVREATEDLYALDSKEAKAKAGEATFKSAAEMLKKYDDALRELSLVARKAEELQKLEDLAERERALADAARSGEMSAEEVAAAENDLKADLDRQLREEKSLNLDREKAAAEGLKKRAEDLARRQEEVGEMSGEEQKNAERQLANDVQRLAGETGELRRKIEERTGVSEMDANRTSEPAAAAQEAGQQAADSAREAAGNMEKGDAAEAKSDMKAVSAALGRAGESLSDVLSRLDGKNAEFSADSAEMNSVQASLSEAASAAREAAQTSAAQPKMNAAMQKAADALSQMARGRMQRANMPSEAFEPLSGESGEPGGDPQENARSHPNSDARSQRGRAEPRRDRRRKASLGELKKDVHADWFRLKGESAREAEADEYEDVPAEYRSLVRDYFRALNESDVPSRRESRMK